MNGEKDNKSFWHTLPGILTGIAAVIGAITTLYVTIYAPIYAPQIPMPVTPTPTPVTPVTPTPTQVTPVTPTPVTPTIPSGTVQGRVLWNEQTVKGATVYVTDLYSFDSTQYGSATTDANGHFSISDIPEGEQYLYVFGNQPEFWVAAVTPFQMVAVTGTLAKDTYLCKGFNPISPQDGQVINTSRPILQWGAFPGAVDYAVRVIRVGESNFVFQRGDDDARIKETSVKVDVDLSRGEYGWRVDGFNVEGHIIACSYYPRSFRVDPPMRPRDPQVTMTEGVAI